METCVLDRAQGSSESTGKKEHGSVSVCPDILNPYRYDRAMVLRCFDFLFYSRANRFSCTFSISRTCYRGTSLITCGGSESACFFLTKTRNFPKNACLFLRELRNFPKNACLFLKKSRNCSKNACFSKTHVQGYLAHKNPPPSIGPPYGPWA